MRKELNPKFHFDGKACKNCGLTKRYIKGGKCVHCIDSRRVRYDTPEYKRAYSRKWLYGLTLEEINGFVSQQEGKCAICLRELDYLQGRKLFHVDHDHKTNTVRGILCNGCNNGLRNFCDDTQLLQRAISYLGGNYATA